MRATKRCALGVAALAGGGLVLRVGKTANRLARRSLHVAERRLRDVSGRLQGASYRLAGGRPDPDISDLVLTDRIRSSLGPLEKRLDLPHVHVMVERHVALLHGVTDTERAAQQIERAVAAVSGVRGVESYLHVGLGANDARPSAGRRAHEIEPSPAKQQLLDAATAAGLPAESAMPVVRAILANFADRLPDGEREQVAAHLPTDVKALFAAPRRTHCLKTARTAEELVARIAAATTELPEAEAAEVTEAVLRTLRALVPDEAADVAAVLPAGIRELWQSS